MVGNDPADIAAVGRDLRARAERPGRDPPIVKILAGARPVVADDGRRGRAPLGRHRRLRSIDGTLARYCGYLGIDLAAWPDDTPGRRHAHRSHPLHPGHGHRRRRHA